MQLSTDQLLKAVSIRQALDELDLKAKELNEQLTAVLSGGKVAVKKAAKKATRKAAKKKKKAVKESKPAKKAAKKGSGKTSGPTQRDVMHQVLRAAKKPITRQEVVQGMLDRGALVGAKDPLKAGSILLYTDDNVTRPGRGLFAAKKS